MFRKVNKHRTAAAGRSRPRPVDHNREDEHEDKDEDEDDDDEDIHRRIRNTQRKHKILEALPVASGEEQPLSKRRFLSTTNSTHYREDDSEHLTVLAQKHHRAMEEYIEGNMEGGNAQNTTSETTNVSNDPEAKLYQELAAATVPSTVLGAIEEDRGTMLVGGTGLAEVILPKDKKFDNSKQLKVGVRYSRNPHLSSAVAGNGGSTAAVVTNNPLPTAGFRSMVPSGNHHTDRPPTAPLNSNLPPNVASSATTTQGIVVSTAEVPKTEPVAVDDSRPGFASLKAAVGRQFRASHSEKPKQRGQQHQKDHEAFTKFIKRERDRR